MLSVHVKHGNEKRRTSFYRHVSSKRTEEEITGFVFSDEALTGGLAAFDDAASLRREGLSSSRSSAGKKTAKLRQRNQSYRVTQPSVSSNATKRVEQSDWLTTKRRDECSGIPNATLEKENIDRTHFAKTIFVWFHHQTQF